MHGSNTAAVMVRLPCGHRFHKIYTAKWFASGKLKLLSSKIFFARWSSEMNISSQFRWFGYSWNNWTMWDATRQRCWEVGVCNYISACLHGYPKIWISHQGCTHTNNANCTSKFGTTFSWQPKEPEMPLVQPEAEYQFGFKMRCIAWECFSICGGWAKIRMKIVSDTFHTNK